MKYKLIACDMDETFLNDDSKIPSKNLEMVKILDDEYGVKFVPASGRGHHSLQNEIKWLGFDKKDNEYIIGLNGATITEGKTGKLLHFEGVDFHIIKNLFDFGKEKDLCIEVYTSDKLYVHNLNDEEKNHMIEKGIDWIDIKDGNIDFLKGENIAKMLFQRSDMAFLRKLKDDIVKTLNPEVSFTYSSNRYLEVNSLNVNKGEGIIQLCKILNISLKEVIAIGDNLNDMDMFRVAGLSVAVSNAVEEVKAAVDYVAENNNNDGILEEIFKKFIM